MRIILVQRSTNKQLVLSLEEFKSRFKTEFHRAYQGYIKHETEKTSFLPEFMQKNHSEADFFLSLAWNFNNYSGSEWYIAKIN